MVVGYVRLSNEDKNKGLDENSKSINNQIKYIKDFAKYKSIIIDKFYIDDGYSGVNYIRPQFEMMLNDLKKYNIDTIITKDFSRLGREYIETNYYIYKYFPENNIRFIAIDDKYDSLIDHANNIFFLLKTLVNDRYIKSTSENIRRVKEIKSKTGSFLGYIAPYGYIKVNLKNKITLVIDKNVQEIIKYIFKSVANNYKLNEVANRLNNIKIDTPITYLNINNGKKSNNYNQWNSKIIYRIIRNPVYVGDNIYRKTEKLNYNQVKRSYIKKNQRIIIKDTHEAIIDRETFIKANQNIRCRKEKVKSIIKIDEFFKENYSKLLCGKCGKNLNLISKNNINYLKCGNCKFIKSYSKVKRNIYEIFYNIIIENVDKNKIISYIHKSFYDLLKKSKRVENVKNNILNKNIKLLYLQKVQNQIQSEYFNNIKNEIIIDKNYLQLKKEKLEQMYDEYIKNINFSTLINKIEIADSIRLYFNFKI